MRPPSRFEIQVWSSWPNAGIGVVVGPASKYLLGVDIDTDEPDIRNAILSALPPTTVIKRGQKGETRFFRAPTIDKSKSWNIAGPEGERLRVCDLIGPGRQTVLPPSLHPSTGQPYSWIGPDALEDTEPADLPELTPSNITAIDAALAAFGYTPEPQAFEGSPALFECTDSRGREYALSALRGCADELAHARPTTRNDTLNAIAYRLGKMAARGWLTVDEIGEQLWVAALANGLIADDGEHRVRATLWSGLRAGLRIPAPDPRERLTKVDPQFAAGLRPRGA